MIEKLNNDTTNSKTVRLLVHPFYMAASKSYEERVISLWNKSHDTIILLESAENLEKTLSILSPGVGVKYLVITNSFNPFPVGAKTHDLLISEILDIFNPSRIVVSGQKFCFSGAEKQPIFCAGLTYHALKNALTEIAVEYDSDTSYPLETFLSPIRNSLSRTHY